MHKNSRVWLKIATPFPRHMLYDSHTPLYIKFATFFNEGPGKNYASAVMRKTFAISGPGSECWTRRWREPRSVGSSRSPSRTFPLISRSRFRVNRHSVTLTPLNANAYYGFSLETEKMYSLFNLKQPICWCPITYIDYFSVKWPNIDSTKHCVV